VYSDGDVDVQWWLWSFVRVPCQPGAAVWLRHQLHAQTAQSARELHDEQCPRKLHRSTGTV